jgi:hypothetical protein
LLEVVSLSGFHCGEGREGASNCKLGGFRGKARGGKNEEGRKKKEEKKEAGSFAHQSGYELQVGALFDINRTLQ